MTEYDFPEQQSVPATAKPDTTISALDEYLTKIEKTQTPDAAGVIHAHVVLAELLPQESGSYSILDQISGICENHETILISLDMRDCRFQVTHEETGGDTPFGSISAFRFTSLESLIAPAELTDLSLYECTNLTWVALPATWKSADYGEFSECSKLKYVFVPRTKTAADKKNYNFLTGVKTALIFDKTAAAFRSKTADFEAPVAIWKNISGCTSAYNPPEVHSGMPFNLTCTIPEDQEKKQTGTVYFVNKNDRNSVLSTLPVTIHKNQNQYTIKNIKTKKFTCPEFDGQDLFVQLRIIFEDGTVAEYYDNQMLLESDRMGI